MEIKKELVLLNEGNQHRTRIRNNKGGQLDRFNTIYVSQLPPPPRLGSYEAEILIQCSPLVGLTSV